MSDRLEHGRAELRRLDPHDPERIKRIFQDISPDFAEHFIQLLGDMYSRPNLTLKQREIITFSSLVTQGHLDRMRTHVLALLTAGMQQVEIIEIVFHLSAYIGLPAAVNALLELEKIFNSLDDNHE